MRKCNLHPYIDDYMSAILSGRIRASRRLKLAMQYIDRKLDNPDVYIDAEKIAKGVELIERYFEMKLLDWELFVFALIHCYYKSADSVVFDEFLLLMGRGNGKNGFISAVSWYLSTHYHGVEGYNIDIIANSEDQAKTSFDDIYAVLEKRWDKLKRFFYKSKEEIRNLRTKSYIRYNTSNARTKDGKRSACLIFDEIHEYENYDTIKVFTSGFGKRRHSRIFKITTNGYVREGVLDDDLAMADDVLRGTITDIGFCPLIWELGDEKDAENPDAWVEANPSLPYFPELRKELEKAATKMKYQPHLRQDFLTKRMNIPKSDKEVAVTEWANIAATNRPMPDLHGRACVVGLDYAKINDWASVNAHFVDGNTRYDINHSWLCRMSPEIDRIKAPWQDWANAGLLTVVDDVEIPPEAICDYILQLGQKYTIKKIAMDSFRWALMANALRGIGWDAKDRDKVKLVRPSDIMRVVPVVDSCFANRHFVWGDNPPLRWATNNTKLSKVSRNEDLGNYQYAKIEGKSRKTDPFMALAACMTAEDALEATAAPLVDLPVITL